MEFAAKKVMWFLSSSLSSYCKRARIFILIRGPQSFSTCALYCCTQFLVYFLVLLAGAIVNCRFNILISYVWNLQGLSLLITSSVLTNHCVHSGCLQLFLIPSSETFRCGGNFFAPVGEFRSPQIPNIYPNSIRCVWKIATDAFRSIALGVKYGSVFDVEQGSSIYSCNHDALSVYDGANKTTRRLGTYCGNGMRTFHTVSSTGSHLYVEFTSDWQQRRSGFQLHYVTYFTGELIMQKLELFHVPWCHGYHPAYVVHNFVHVGEELPRKHIVTHKMK